MLINPLTKKVIDAFLDEKAPTALRIDRKSKLKSERPELYGALQDLVNAAIEKNAI